MRFGNEVLSPSEYTFPSADLVRSEELKVAVQLIQSLRSAFEPEKYKDIYSENLTRILEARAKGKRVQLRTTDRGEPEPQVLDLMARLRESLEQGKKAAAGGRKSRSRRPAPARSRRKKTA
jgi:DNA end-binding protein Ku